MPWEHVGFRYPAHRSTTCACELNYSDLFMSSFCDANEDALIYSMNTYFFYEYNNLAADC